MRVKKKEKKPYIQLKEYSFAIPNIQFIGYDKNGNAKFKKTKSK